MEGRDGSLIFLVDLITVVLVFTSFFGWVVTFSTVFSILILISVYLSRERFLFKFLFPLSFVSVVWIVLVTIVSWFFFGCLRSAKLVFFFRPLPEELPCSELCELFLKIGFFLCFESLLPFLLIWSPKSKIWYYYK